jgi:hypothetical protein
MVSDCLDMGVQVRARDAHVKAWFNVNILELDCKPAITALNHFGGDHFIKTVFGQVNGFCWYVCHW